MHPGPGEGTPLLICSMGDPGAWKRVVVAITIKPSKHYWVLQYVPSTILSTFTYSISFDSHNYPMKLAGQIQSILDLSMEP